MPKLGMGPVRRAQIFQASVEVIARETFCGATIKKVADAAGVSTGTVNHYFENKLVLLMETLKHVSTEWKVDLVEAVQSSDPGAPKVEALVLASGPNTPENVLRWRVWMAAWSESVQCPELRVVLDASWGSYLSLLAEQILDVAADFGVAGIDVDRTAREFDALQNGLYLQSLTTDLALYGDPNDLLREFLESRLLAGVSVPVHRRPVRRTKAAASAGVRVESR